MKRNPFAKASTLLREREARAEDARLAKNVSDALTAELKETHRIHGGTLRLGVIRIPTMALEANLRRIEPTAHVDVDRWGDDYIVTVHYHQVVEEAILNRMKAEFESAVKPDWT